MGVEPTSGEFIIEGGCYKYDVELYPENDDKYHICVSDSIEFAHWCASQ